MTEELRAFAARNHCRVGVSRLIASCPSLREALARDAADACATRAKRAWSGGEYASVARDMRGGLPTWRTAAALGRTCAAVEKAKVVVRGTMPPEEWGGCPI